VISAALAGAAWILFMVASRAGCSPATPLGLLASGLGTFDNPCGTKKVAGSPLSMELTHFYLHDQLAEVAV